MKNKFNIIKLNSPLRLPIGLVLLALLYIPTYGQSFTNITLSQGLDIQTVSTDYFGSGCSFYDFNQDGWDDVSFAIENDTQAIYINNQGIFEPADFHIVNQGETKMILWVDYDNDEDLDLFLTTRNGNLSLWNNDGQFNLTNVTNSALLSSTVGNNMGAAFGDYDRDGDLDLYVCRYTGFGDSTNSELVNNLYQNNGDGTFADVTFASGVSDGVSPSFQGIWVDYNRDGWPDLFVVNDRNNSTWQNGLYLNNTDGTFTNVADSAGVVMPGAFPMTGSFADFDNDNDLDLFVSSSSAFLTDLPSFLVNQNDGTFQDEAQQYNLQLDNTTWGGLWLDYDNDLDQDLYVATDWLYSTPIQARNYFMINQYPLPFEEDSTLMIGSDTASSHAVARGDINRDGFYDIAVHTDAPSYAQIWQNSGNGHNSISITLRGTTSNSMAIGSWIKVFIDGNQYTQYTFCGENYYGQNSQHHLFGTGTATTVDSVKIEYLSGITDKYYNLSTNNDYLFIEGETQQMFSIEITGNTPICNGDSVVLSAPDYVQYLWSTGDTTQSIAVFEPGAYYLEVIDSLGLQNESFVVNIDTVESADILLDYVPISCNNGTDGEIFLEVSNQGQEYTTTWSNGQQGDTLSNLEAGLYTYVYEDEFSCKSEGQILLEEPSPLNVQLSIGPQTEDSWGSFQWLVNGGSPPYTASLNADTIAPFVDSLVSGFYSFLLLDDNDCSWLENIEIPFIADSVINSLDGKANLNSIQVYHHSASRTISISRDGAFPDELNLKLFNVLGKEISLANHTREQGKNKQILINYSQTNYRGLFFLVISYGKQTQSFPLLLD